MAYYVYIVECADGTLYTGITTDVGRRMAEHNAGTGAKYTKTRTPVHPVYVEECDDRSSASRREYAIKRLSRKQKEELIVAGPAVVECEGVAASDENRAVCESPTVSESLAAYVRPAACEGSTVGESEDEE